MSADSRSLAPKPKTPVYSESKKSAEDDGSESQSLARVHTTHEARDHVHDDKSDSGRSSATNSSSASALASNNIENSATKQTNDKLKRSTKTVSKSKSANIKAPEIKRNKKPKVQASYWPGYRWDKSWRLWMRRKNNCPRGHHTQR